MKYIFICFTACLFFISCGHSNDGFLLRVHDVVKDQYGYVNQKGDTIIPLGKYAICFTDTLKGYAIVSSSDFSSGLIAIDKKEQVLYQVFNFDNGPDYISEGLFRIIKDGKIGYANGETGKIVIEPCYCGAMPFEDGVAKVAYSCQKLIYGEHYSWVSNEWFYINKFGESVDNPSPDNYLLKIENNKYNIGTEYIPVEIINNSNNVVSLGDYYRIDRLNQSGQWEEVKFKGVGYNDILHVLPAGESIFLEIWLYPKHVIHPYEEGLYRIVKSLNVKEDKIEIESVFELV